MDRKTMLQYFLCFLVLSSENEAMKKEALFLRRRSLDGLVGQGHFSELKARSRVQCSSVCLGDNQCRSFTYEEDRRACFLHQSHSPLPGDSRPGAATFYRKWTHCPRGWDLLDENVCVKLISEKMSWQKAVQNCLQLGGNLISVETQTKESDLRSYLKDLDVWPVWLGASNLEVEGEWKWEATWDTAHIRWLKPEPNGGTRGNCLAMSKTNLKVLDASCSSSFISVCEIPL